MKSLNFDSTITISIVVALAAIVSPVLVEIVKSIVQLIIRHMDIKKERTEKTLDVYYADKKTAFDEFVVAAGKYESYLSISAPPEISGALHAKAHSAILFCKEENKSKIIGFLNYINDLNKLRIRENEESKFNSHMFEISTALNDELFELRASINNPSILKKQNKRKYPKQHKEQV